MRTLPRTYLGKFKRASLKKIPLIGGVIGFVIILFFSLTFLALPAKASLDRTAQVKKLNDFIILKFPFPVRRDLVEVEIYPPVGFDYEWSGILVNQELVIKPANLLQPAETYSITVKNVQNPLGTSEANKTFSFQTEDLPKVIGSYPDPDEGRVKPNPTISFTLDKTVEYGDYQLVTDPIIYSDYKRIGNTIQFTPIKPLKQNAEYLIGLQFTATGIEPSTLFEGNFLVVKPLKIVKTDPKHEIKNASKKTEVKLTFNKELKPLFLGSFIKIKPFSEVLFEVVDKKTVKITPKPQFVTDTDYQITVEKTLEAADGAILEDDFKLTFKTAGPVNVASSTPSGFGTPLASLISVTFDQKVDKISAEKNFSTKPNLAGSFTWASNTMTFIPSSVFSLFKPYSFSLAKGIKGPGGEPSNKNFSFNFVTTSERQAQLGKSVKGRPISAYYFGVGSKKILLIGSMHGSEANTKDLMSGWVSFLRANQNLIPTDRTFIIIPNSNPDGVASENRFNAHKVDLNRNWDTPSWQKDSYWTYGKVVGGGGTKPFSEPETRALRDLINRENPKITISYHSAAGVIISDGISDSLRDWYYSKTGYTAVAGAPTPYEDEFSYDVTGTLEEWAGDVKGKVILVVELATSWDSEYLRNLPALKGLLTYKL